MNGDLATFLRSQKPLVNEKVLWNGGNFPLHVTSYLSQDLPPLGTITSVRAVVLRNAAVLVVRDPENTHILPGGRREVGETVLQTLRRELLEEAGWALTNISLLGFKHFHPLETASDGSATSDFLQLVYVALAGSFMPEAKDPDAYELEALFHPLSEIANLPLTPGEKLFLRAALAHIKVE